MFGREFGTRPLLRTFFVVSLASATAIGQDNPAVRLISQKCLPCHNVKTPSSGLSLEDRESTLMGGNRGAAVVPGKPQGSLLVTAIRQTDSLKMPPTGK